MNMTQEVIALVSGATGSVGQAVCERLLAEPNVAVVHGIGRSNRFPPTLGSKMQFHFVDLSKGELNSLPSCVDILINCAGQASEKNETAEVERAELVDLMELNAFAAARLAARYLPGMRERGYGRIVNVGSIWSLRASARNLAYTMSKHALSGLTKTIATEYIEYGITCNEVCPGPIDSEMMTKIIARFANEAGVTTAEQRLRFEKTLRGKRMVTPEEVASAVIFLTRRESSGINGVSLPVDLGFIA